MKIWAETNLGNLGMISTFAPLVLISTIGIRIDKVSKYQDQFTKLLTCGSTILGVYGSRPRYLQLQTQRLVNLRQHIRKAHKT